MADDSKLLDLVENIDRKLDAANLANEQRFAVIEREQASLRTEVSSLAQTQARQGAEFVESLNKCASAAANAADIGLRAQARASDVRDESAKLVQGAMTIHNASIAATVDHAISAAVKPVAEAVAALKVSDEAQDKKFEAILAAIGAIAKTLGHPKLRTMLLVCAALGALAGGAAAGWKAHEASKVITAPAGR